MILSLGLLADERNQSWTLAMLTVWVTAGCALRLPTGSRRRAGKLYEIERWIASGKSIHTQPQTKKTPLQVAIYIGVPVRR